MRRSLPQTGSPCSLSRPSRPRRAGVRAQPPFRPPQGPKRLRPREKPTLPHTFAELTAARLGRPHLKAPRAPARLRVMTSLERRGRGLRANAHRGQATVLRDQVDRTVSSGFPNSYPNLVFMCVLDFLSVLKIVSQVGQVNFKHPTKYSQG